MIARRTLTAVTLVAVALHVLLGCCWHHTHPCESEANVSARVSECACHGHSKSGDDSSSDSTEEPHACDGVACAFCLPDTSGFEVSFDMSPVLLSPAASNIIFAQSSANGLKRSLAFGRAAIKLPEPLHALSQVWLI